MNRVSLILHLDSDSQSDWLSYGSDLHPLEALEGSHRRLGWHFKTLSMYFYMTKENCHYYYYYIKSHYVESDVTFFSPLSRSVLLSKPWRCKLLRRPYGGNINVRSTTGDSRGQEQPKTKELRRLTTVANESTFLLSRVSLVALELVLLYGRGKVGGAAIEGKVR